jgi:hypothetical protein
MYADAHTHSGSRSIKKKRNSLELIAMVFVVPEKFEKKIFPFITTR